MNRREVFGAVIIIVTLTHFYFTQTVPALAAFIASLVFVFATLLIDQTKRIESEKILDQARHIFDGHTQSLTDIGTELAELKQKVESLMFRS